MANTVKCWIVSFDSCDSGRRIIGVTDEQGVTPLIHQDFVKHNTTDTSLTIGDPSVSMEDGVLTTTYPIVGENDENDIEDCYLSQQVYCFTDLLT